jgi:fructose-1,6-bisphosphatase/inositol monophosphatase family enzyme
MDLVVEHQLASHDIMALVPVMEAAGAVVTDWQGMAIDLNGDGSILAAANKTLHRLALSEIQQVAG